MASAPGVQKLAYLFSGIAKSPVLSSGDFAICVQDNGIGVSEADVTIAMQPFSQVDNALARRFEGTGLGLPASKALMDLHGGRLSIQSSRSVGTVVTLSFPTDRIRPPSQSVAAE
jgi:signal transduction histidine kinase